MSREGQLYRVAKTSGMFTRGSIVRLVKDDGDDLPAFTLVLGDVVANVREMYEKPGPSYSGPYIFDSLRNMEKI